VNALTDHLITRITNQGPLTIADYMAECLLHPTLGYYPTRDPLGTAGDFTTAPEISQMFGELIGLSLAQAWLDQGQPETFVLAELGPGRGTLMADALRAIAGVPAMAKAAQVHFVEVSPVLRAAQAQAVPQATWHDGAETLPDLPLFVIANEFFDALPIRQFVRDGTGWRERQVGVVDGALAIGLSQAAPLAELEPRLNDTKDGDLVETCTAATGVMAQIGTRIAARGGAALIIDYGDWVSLGDTFQALRSHTSEGPLVSPGQADLTAHVDFAALSAVCAPATYSLLTPQGVFLERLGITQRAQALAKNLSGPALDAHIAAHHRLTHPAEMGNLFKVMGVTPKGAPPLAGLEAGNAS